MPSEVQAACPGHARFAAGGRLVKLGQVKKKGVEDVYRRPELAAGASDCWERERAVPAETYSLTIWTCCNQSLGGILAMRLGSYPGLRGAQYSVHEIAKGGESADAGKNISYSDKGNVVFHVKLRYVESDVKSKAV